MSDLTMRVLRATAFDNCDSIFWRTDDKYAPVTFLAICNDTFAWGTADCEQITEENVAVFEAASADCLAAGFSYFTSSLFAARVRRQRPQGAFYRSLCGKEALVRLFDECGPEREVGLGNPMSREEGKE